MLAEDVLCISTVISQLQKRMDNCTDVNTPHSKSNTNETSESRKASNDVSCVIIPESPKSPERSVDLGVVETNENELHSISGDEMESKSTATTSHGSDQIMDLSLINGQNQSTYAEAVKSSPPAKTNRKSLHVNETHTQNNQAKTNKQTKDLTSDGFIGVERKRKRNKSFFLSGIEENVKKSQVYSYMVDRHIVPIKISLFKSKRKGTVSARILIPSNCSEKVLSKNFWPKFIHCKLWQPNEITRDSVDQNVKSTISGTNSA